ncbi:MAG: ribosome small subunit-dependent GTPase A [Phycisphaerales bacterium]|nr:MAG: ribosome small subunit-dependent GTPase A [Phycisphaerales bacterium]
MSPPPGKRRSKKGRKVRVDLRRNRSKPRRIGDWTQQARDEQESALDATNSEQIVPKGELSRRRTVFIHDETDRDAEGLNKGTVIAMRGLYADVDDGERVWPCTVRRMLRTRLIEGRHPVTVGDRVTFSVEPEVEGVEQEGVIESVEQRHGKLRRRVGRKTHTIVANVEQAIIVSSAAQPIPKPHLIDRYIVASLAGEITPVICMNKKDLDEDDIAALVLGRYQQLSYATLLTSAITGEGIDALCQTLQGRVSVIAGQSGVGKSSLLNAIQPGLELRIGDINEQLQRGRHTTTTATMLRLDIGGYVVDTPGVRSFDVSMIARNEFEEYFVDLAEHVPNCKFPDCTHIHESACAVKLAVERGHIHPERYESYRRLFEEEAESA